MTTHTIRILFFAAARERCGLSEELFSFTSPCTLLHVQSYLFEKYPSLEELKPYLKWAINESFQSNINTVLNNHDIVAIIPPISGG